MSAHRLNRSFETAHKYDPQSLPRLKTNASPLLPQINTANREPFANIQDRYYQDTTFATADERRRHDSLQKRSLLVTAESRSEEQNNRRPERPQEPQPKHHRSMSNPRAAAVLRERNLTPVKRGERVGAEFYNKFKEINNFGGKSPHLRGLEPIFPLQIKALPETEEHSFVRNKAPFELKPSEILNTTPYKERISTNNSYLQLEERKESTEALDFIQSNAKLNAYPTTFGLSNEDEPFDLDHIEDSYKQLLDTRNPRLYKVILAKYYPVKR